MNKITFAKLFEFKDYQVLVTMEFNEKDDSWKVNQQTDLGDFRPNIAVNFYDEKSCQKCFDEYHKGHAQNFIDTINKMFIEFSNPSNN
jgi:hypothetical protein